MYVYKWEDVQIQHGIGDIHIDMTKAANIKETNTIVVRHILGKVQVVVPLNYNINLHATLFYGTAYVNDKSYKIENNHVQIEEKRKMIIILLMFTFHHSLERRGDLQMNHYIRAIGSMLILVYSMLIAFIY